MNKAKLLAFLWMIIVIFSMSCQKERPVKEYKFMQLTVDYKSFGSEETPPVQIWVGNTVIGGVGAGKSFSKLIPRSDSIMDLIIKDADLNVLMDTTFVPTIHNNFSIVISNALGFKGFYKDSNPPDQEHFRLRLVNRLKSSDPNRKLDFKFFRNGDIMFSFYESTSFEIRNVGYGELSESIDLPITQLEGIDQIYYIKAYDAVTGEVLFDLIPGVDDIIYGALGLDMGALKGGSVYVCDIVNEEGNESRFGFFLTYPF
jgi:hypothetical protein